MKNEMLTWLRAALFPILGPIVLLQLMACSDSTPYVTSASGDTRADQFISSLNSIGYSVKEGSAHLTDPVTIGYRAYVNPKTTHGPGNNNIIPDRAIRFKMPK